MTKLYFSPAMDITPYELAMTIAFAGMTVSGSMIDKLPSIARRHFRELPPGTDNPLHQKPIERCDYEISDDGVMTATETWVRDNEATTLRLLGCHSIDLPLGTVAAWTDDQVKLADIWAWSCYLSASDHDDIQVPPKPDFIPDASPFPLDRNPITGEPI